MAITKPPVNTRVRVTVDNAHQRSYSVVWCPETYSIEGTVYFSNGWDPKDSIRLVCTNHSIVHPVIPISSIVKLEQLGKNDRPLSVEVKMDKTPTEPPKATPSEITFSIESSKKGQFYKVIKRGDYWTCNCIAGSHHKACKHVKQAQAQLESAGQDNVPV